MIGSHNVCSSELKETHPYMSPKTARKLVTSYMHFSSEWLVLTSPTPLGLQLSDSQQLQSPRKISPR